MLALFWLEPQERSLSLSKVVGFDRLNQLHRALLRRYVYRIKKLSGKLNVTDNLFGWDEDQNAAANSVCGREPHP